MPRSLLVLAGLFILPSLASAQTLDKEKLRKAVYWPRDEGSTSLLTEVRDGRGKKINFDRKIEELRQELRGWPEDAEIHLKLAGFYLYSDRRDESTAELAKAEELLRPHLETNDRSKGYLLALHAWRLWQTNPKDTDVFEKWARRATEVSPGDWRCWLHLGWYLTLPAANALGEEMTKGPGGSLLNPMGLLPKDTSPALTPEDYADVERRFNDAVDCFARAYALGSDNPKMLREFVYYRLSEMMLRFALNRAKGKSANGAAAVSLPRIHSMLRHAARLNPDQLNLQFMAAVDLRQIMEQSGVARQYVSGKLADIPEESRKRKEFIARLQEATHDGHHEVAAYAHALLAIVHSSDGRMDLAFDDAQRAYQLNPALEFGTDNYETMLLSKGIWNQALGLAEMRFRVEPSLRNRNLLARNHAVSGPAGFDKAQSRLRRNLELAPQDAVSLLTLATVLLRNGDKPGALEEVGELLAEVRPLLNARSQTFRVDFQCTEAIWKALRGEDLGETRRTLQCLALKSGDPEQWRNFAEAFEFELSKPMPREQRLRAAAQPAYYKGLDRYPVEVYERIIHAPNLKESIADLRQQLRGQADDALLHWKISRLDSRAGKIQDSSKTLALAVDCFQVLLAKDPNNSYWSAVYASALLEAGRTVEANALAGKLFENQNPDWRTCLALADYSARHAANLIRSAFTTTTPDASAGPEAKKARTTVAPNVSRRVLPLETAAPSPSPAANSGDPGATKAPAAQQKPPYFPQIDVAKSLLVGLEGYLDRAAKLAPDEPEVWLTRLRIHIDEENVYPSIQALRGEMASAISNEARFEWLLRDVRSLCRLSPRNHNCQIFIGMLLYKLLDKQPDRRPQLEQCAQTLEKIAQTADAAAAGECFIGAAFCRWCISDFQTGLVSARKALQLKPQDPAAWNITGDLLAWSQAVGERKELLEEQVKTLPNAVCHFSLGALAHELQDYDAAEKHFQAGLKYSEHDVNCIMGLAATHLARIGSGDHLAEAERWLAKAEGLLAGQKNSDYFRLYGILRALQGDTVISAVYLRQAEALNPNCPHIKAAIAALQTP